MRAYRQLTLALALSGAGCAGPVDQSDAGPRCPDGGCGEQPTIRVERCFVDLDTTREGYAERLRGMWLAESVANWTGLVTESQRRAAPFYRDEDWGSAQGRWDIEGSAMGRIELNFLDPWGSDDDTDVELVYLEAMREAGTVHLSPAQIRDAWRAHILPDVYVWVSNRAVRRLFDQPIEVLPPSTGLLVANDQSLMIDAQLTTEVFGALSPGQPAHALELAHLPILTTASGYAAHAAQLHVAMYALAAVVDPALTPAEQVGCLVAGARLFVPDSSKVADVIDLVVELHDASRDRDDWESARDELARIFQAEDEAHGYRYLEWYESTVNLAAGVLALLYGEGELVRTIRIGTLSGWDSDNGTATMGGLLGLLRGEAWVRAELAREGHTEVSDRYRIARTRVGFPQDVYTLGELAELMRPRVEEALVEAGGALGAGGAMTSEAPSVVDLGVARNPYVRWLAPSATGLARSRGDMSLVAQLASGERLGEVPLEVLVDGLELDASGRDRRLELRDEAQLETAPMRARYLTATSADTVSFEIRWTEPVSLAGARFVEGPASTEGGWLEDARLEVLGDGGWATAPLAEPLDARPSRAFEVHDLLFAAPLRARGVRLSGTPGGRAREVTIAELDGLLAE